MNAAQLHFKLRRGASFHRLLVLQDADGAPVNLTGYVPLSEARVRAGADLAFALPWTLTNAAGGELTIDLTPATTSALPAGRFVWDLLLQHTESGRIYGPFCGGDILSQDGPTTPAL